MSHPYRSIGRYARWDTAFNGVEPAAVDPVVRFGMTLTREHRVVTAGSCFAQHIGRYLKREGFNYLVTERGHPLLNDETRAAFGYGFFSARYGNIYTTRQLLQLFRRAYGTFTPSDDVWERGAIFADPFRPNIQPGGFPTRQELEADREQHLAAVREAFEQLDVFVFTLGLTECWAARKDGAVFPLAPGVAGGTFDHKAYEFTNLTVDDVTSELREFIGLLRSVNPNAHVILTVSPVPLMATAVDQHVLVSTTYSKSVLRVAAQMTTETLDGVYYFPAYEIVTGNFSRGSYFADDLRSIREEGVKHVMSLFFSHATNAAPSKRRTRLIKREANSDEAYRAFERKNDELVEVLCDEELLTAAAPPEAEPATSSPTRSPSSGGIA